MTRFEVVAAVVAGVLACVLPYVRGQRAGELRSRAARGVLWLALGSPIPFLLIHPFSRPCMYVSGPRGAFEATRLLALAAAASALALTALERLAARPAPRFAWGAGAYVLGVSLAGLLAATALVL